MTRREQQLTDTLRELLRAFDSLMPGLRYIAVPDYQVINEAPLAARRLLSEDEVEGE
jgi:hypothetical protein